MFRIICTLTLIVLLSLVGSTTSQGQVITLTFTGQYQAAPLPVDSVLIMNLSQGGDTTLYFPDTLLVLGTTGVVSLGATGVFALLPNHPNPFSGTTSVDLHVQEAGVVRMGVSDALGREVAGHQGTLSPGTHRFAFQGGMAGVHILWVEMNGARRSIRMVSTGDGVRHQAKLLYMGSSAPMDSSKSGRALFTWEPGDQLRYIGYGTTAGGSPASGWIEEVPVNSTDHVFTFANGFPCPDSPTVTDIDGNNYPVVQIGDQCWMAANLRTASYRDGSTVPNVTDNTAWTQLNTGAWSNYGNDPSNDPIYGKLYNWFAAADPLLCPQGWHLPTDAEWQQMELALGMPAVELNSTGLRGGAQNVGGMLKATSLWDAPNTGATNETGFSSVPSGYRFSSVGSFDGLGNSGFWWSATENGTQQAWFRSMYFSNAGIDRGSSTKRPGYCVRCVRD
jgi:uncharacterized protein (TIGR02145 family)